ncbi:uncharacterized protein MONOS_13312 [Monocercomonoides exilis]|uniref:uncharacterized protein n=1 Tax=Monocercomonoides exilis TaxID=2049356 RepID=UPI00355959F9|nr:hypothetical protein MONOS_13312 [Monocercomonoides exilis]|eukprot:MONOS_13312.1-p1 / transcript=MONOS_13312.1 / gene=MONOS_13312 / organism=Monocercomonoides_exilis_PA203 / gene_product=unspecified product / transcript_product=unspecified product / location=Mono_scaffold00806:30340-31083(-) / protein_length=201 / sequence_SO=supercontig / SO=protein_coding / is_pseudo=false
MMWEGKVLQVFFGSQKKPYKDEEVKSTSRFTLANEEVSELCANNNGEIPTKECIQELTKISAIHPTVQNQSGGYYEIHRFTRLPDSSPSGYICDFIIPILTAGPRSTFCYALFTLPLSISEVLSSKISLKPIIKEIVKLSSKITVSKLKWIDTNSNEEMNYYWKNMCTKQATPQEEKEKEDGINESESSCKTSKVATVES